MNTAARIENVKVGEQRFNSPRELEAYLRDVGRFSQSQAKAIVARGFKGLVNEPQTADVSSDLERLKNLLSVFGKQS